MEGRTFHFRGPQASRHSIPRDMLDSDRLPATLEVSVTPGGGRAGDAAAPQQDRGGSLGWLEAKPLRGDCLAVPLFLPPGREPSRPPGVGNLAGHAKFFTEI